MTTREIEHAIVHNWLKDMTRYTIIPRLGFGLLNHEADLAIISQSGELTEVEIKRSLTDLKADFHKEKFHQDERVYKFYYCLPISIMQDAFRLFDKHKDLIKQMLGTTEYRRPAVLWYDESGIITACGYARTKGRKLTTEERAIAGRLMSIKYWDVQLNINK